MIDHHEARIWAEYHGAFGRWAETLVHDIGDAFRVLARVQYDQPWKREAEPAPIRRAID